MTRTNSTRLSAVVLLVGATRLACTSPAEPVAPHVGLDTTPPGVDATDLAELFVGDEQLTPFDGGDPPRDRPTDDLGFDGPAEVPADLPMTAPDLMTTDVSGREAPDGCAGDACAPVRVIEIAAGQVRTCALLSSGLVRCWGDRPGLWWTVSGLRDVVHIATSGPTTCAVLRDGSLRCLGNIGDQRLGTPDSGVNTTVPLGVAGLEDVREVSVGLSALCAVTGDDRLTCWGSNAYQQLGVGDAAMRTYGLTRFLPVEQVEQVSVGYDTVCARTARAEVWCWYRGTFGQLGDGRGVDSTAPVRVDVTDAVDLAVGDKTACAVRRTGEVVCWGDNQMGQAGGGADSGTRALRPVVVPNVNAATDVAVGSAHACAIVGDGTVRCWGDNRAGRLGDGAAMPGSATRTVLSVRNAVQLAAGSEHTCALSREGQVWCWGANRNGQLGDGTFIARATPIQVGLVDADCTDGRTLCGGVCVDISRSPDHCGACGNACPFGTPCDEGRCGCPRERPQCGDRCVDTQSDPAHCGGCNSRCGSRLCIMARCGCPAGMMECGDACFNTMTDRDRCGGCDSRFVCADGASCVAGRCECPTGQTACGMAPDPRVCVDLQRDSTNCGRCGNACPAGQFCLAGVCGSPYPPTVSMDAATVFINACDAPGHTTYMWPSDSQPPLRIPWPFEFPWWNQRYLPGQRITVSPVGLLFLDGPIGAGGADFLDRSAPNNQVAVYDRLGLNPRNPLCVVVTGTAPNRRWVLEWDDAGSEDRHTTFEIVLHEGTGNIDFIYPRMETTEDARVGIENPAGDQAVAGCPMNPLPDARCMPSTGMRIRFTR